MAAAPYSSSYAAQSLGLAPVASGKDIGTLLQNQLAEQAKKRAQRNPQQDGQMSAAAFDLFGQTPNAQ